MYLEINEINLYYEEYGPDDSDAVIFLHGNGGSMRTFERTKELFLKGYKVVLIDSRGHGKSIYDGSISIPMIAADLAAFVTAKGFRDISLVGYSDGGNVALEAAAMLGGNVKKLIAIGANTRLDGMKWFCTAGVKMSCGIYSALAFTKKYKEKKRLYQIMLKQPEITDEKLSNITAKTLIVAGENDMIKDGHTREIASKIKGAELKIVAGGNHFLFSKRNGEINAIIKEFLS